MEHITPQEYDIIRRLHLEGRGIHVVAHAPQQSGGCHPFVFLRGVFSGETDENAFQRVKPDILQHIATSCGRSCQCTNGTPTIAYTRFGLN